MRVSGFDWDKGNLAKCLKHGVSLAEIESCLRAAREWRPT